MMQVFDRLLLLVCLMLVGFGSILAWRAAARILNWRRTLDRVERTAWNRVLAELRASGQQ